MYNYNKKSRISRICPILSVELPVHSFKYTGPPFFSLFSRTRKKRKFSLYSYKQEKERSLIFSLPSLSKPLPLFDSAITWCLCSHRREEPRYSSSLLYINIQVFCVPKIDTVIPSKYFPFSVIHIHASTGTRHIYNIIYTNYIYLFAWEKLWAWEILGV